LSLGEQRPQRNRLRGSTDPEALLEQLAAEGFSGALSKRFSDDLWVYGFDVLRGMVRTGSIDKVNTGTAHGTIGPEDRRLLHESAPERDALVVDTLVRTVPAFIKGLRRGNWRAAGGASLETYLIGACARRFWDVYASWAGARRRHLLTMDTVGSSLREEIGELSAAERLAQRDALRAIVAQASPEQRAILGGLWDGKTHQQIAAELGLTEAGVGGRLYRLRGKAWQAVQSGRIDPSLIPGSRVAALLGGAS
jgi:DNA-directed RNA polymerase specialized sigma24 family protein